MSVLEACWPEIASHTEGKTMMENGKPSLLGGAYFPAALVLVMSGCINLTHARKREMQKKKKRESLKVRRGCW